MTSSKRAHVVVATIVLLSACVLVGIIGSAAASSDRSVTHSSSQQPSAAPAAPAPVRRVQTSRPQPAGEENVVAIVNARVLPVAGPALERGTVVLRGGRIAAVATDAPVPAGARVIDATGKIVTPGWLDSATQLGIVEIPL